MNPVWKLRRRLEIILAYLLIHCLLWNSAPTLSVIVMSNHFVVSLTQLWMPVPYQLTPALWVFQKRSVRSTYLHIDKPTEAYGGYEMLHKCKSCIRFSLSCAFMFFECQIHLGTNCKVRTYKLTVVNFAHGHQHPRSRKRHIHLLALLKSNLFKDLR